MRFCGTCGSIMVKAIVNQVIVFECHCGLRAEGGPEDTMWHEEYIERQNLAAKHEIAIENAPHDAARHLVSRQCPQCKIDRMTQVFIPPDMYAFYVCECGYRSAK